MNSKIVTFKLNSSALKSPSLKALRKEGTGYIYIVANMNAMKLQLFNQDNKMNCLP